MKLFADNINIQLKSKKISDINHIQIEINSFLS